MILYKTARKFKTVKFENISCDKISWKVNRNEKKSCDVMLYVEIELSDFIDKVFLSFPL